MILSNRIRCIREAYALTQAEIAYQCDISPSAYGQIERKANTASFNTLKKIADAIGVSISFLINIDEPSFLEKQVMTCLNEKNIDTVLLQQKLLETSQSHESEKITNLLLVDEYRK